MLGDEELEEGLDVAHCVERGDIARSIRQGHRGGGWDRDINGERGGESERRLSQELERGFRDSSDEEEDRRIRNGGEQRRGA